MTREQALHDALREFATEEWNGGLRFKRCKLCKAEWGGLDAEQHAPGCLAAPTVNEEKEQGDAVALLRRDAERYRTWRSGHAAGMRPFLPTTWPVDVHTSWTYPFEYDPPHDEWMTASPEKRCEMIDAYLDALPEKE
jgi:hypothetical protein